MLTISDKIGSHFLAHEHGYRKSVASTPCPPSSWRETKGEKGRKEGEGGVNGGKRLADVPVMKLKLQHFIKTRHYEPKLVTLSVKLCTLKCIYRDHAATFVLCMQLGKDHAGVPCTTSEFVLVLLALKNLY